jgi:hypothetical protein
MNTTSPSTKRIDTHSEFCPSCRLWYGFLHPALDGRDLCPMCLALSGEKRSAWVVEHSAHTARPVRR